MLSATKRNAVVAIVQVAVNGFVLFFLYRFLLSEIGPAKLGVWSVVMALVSVSKFAQLGFSGSTIKYVAKHLARNDKERAARSMQTAVVSTVLLVGLLCVLAYPVLRLLLEKFVPEDGVRDAIAILPFALIAFWLNAIGSVYQSALDGCQRVDIRGYVMILSYGAYYLAAIQLVNSLGLEGFVYAQIVNAVVILLLGWYAVGRIMTYIPKLPLGWYKAEFREMFSYGVNFQLVSLTQMMYEPVTKLLIGHFGGLAVTGYYELANRMILQLRTLLVAGNQVLVPVIAEAQEKEGKGSLTLYHQSYRITVLLSIPFFCLLVALMPAISVLWIGHYVSEFVVPAIILAVAWWVNAISVPAYFSYLGKGELRWPVVGHLLNAVANVFLGLLFGKFLGGIGPVIGWALALSIGSCFLLVKYALEQQIPLASLIPKDMIPILLVSLFVAITGLSVYFITDSAISESLFVFLLLPIIFMMLHPLRCASNIPRRFR